MGYQGMPPPQLVQSAVKGQLAMPQHQHEKNFASTSGQPQHFSQQHQPQQQYPLKQQQFQAFPQEAEQQRQQYLMMQATQQQQLMHNAQSSMGSVGIPQRENNSAGQVMLHQQGRGSVGGTGLSGFSSPAVGSYGADHPDQIQQQHQHQHQQQQIPFQQQMYSMFGGDIRNLSQSAFDSQSSQMQYPLGAKGGIVTPALSAADQMMMQGSWQQASCHQPQPQSSAGPTQSLSFMSLPNSDFLMNGAAEFLDNSDSHIQELACDQGTSQGGSMTDLLHSI